MKLSKSILVACGLLVVSPAYSADVAPAPVLKAPPALAPVGCTPTNCTGFYVGGNIIGAGTSTDVGATGSSSLAAGGMLGGQAGWQIWNGALFAAVEVTANYDATGTNGGQPGYFVAQLVKLGGALPNPFTGTPAPSQGPLQIAGASMISPFFEGGTVERRFGVGWATGVGTEFALGGPYMGFVDYLHIGYNATVNPALKVNSEDVIRIGVNWKH